LGGINAAAAASPLGKHHINYIRINIAVENVKYTYLLTVIFGRCVGVKFSTDAVVMLGSFH